MRSPTALASLKIDTAHSLVINGFGRNFKRRRHRAWVAQSLRCDPVLTVGAVQIAAEHAKAVGERTGIGVEEGFLLDRIALHASGISPRNIELAGAIKAHLAHTSLAFGNRATMTAGETADAIIPEILNQGWIGFAYSLVEDVAQRGQVGSLCLF